MLRSAGILDARRARASRSRRSRACRSPVRGSRSWQPVRGTRFLCTISASAYATSGACPGFSADRSARTRRGWLCSGGSNSALPTSWPSRSGLFTSAPVTRIASCWPWPAAGRRPGPPGRIRRDRGRAGRAVPARRVPDRRRVQGTAPVRRGSATLAVDPALLRNPLVSSHLLAYTSGSRGARTRSRSTSPGCASARST